MTAAEDSGKLQVYLPLQVPSQTPGPLAKPAQYEVSKQTRQGADNQTKRRAMCSRAAESRDGYLLSVVVSFPFIVSGVTIPLLRYPNRNTLEYSPLGIPPTVQVT